MYVLFPFYGENCAKYIYNNDIANVTNLFDYIICVDDTTLSRVLNSFKCNALVSNNINNELDKISE